MHYAEPADRMSSAQSLRHDPPKPFGKGARIGGQFAIGNPRFVQQKPSRILSQAAFVLKAA